MTDGRQPKTDSIVSLRDYVDARFDSVQMALDKANDVLNSRLVSAETGIERRLDILNHLRDNVITKADCARTHSSFETDFRSEASMLRAEVAMLKEWRAEQRGKASVASVYLAYALAVVSLVISLVATVHNLIS